MSIDKKIISEIQKFHKINRYISEQDVPPADPLGAPAADLGAPAPVGDVPPPADAAAPPVGGAPTTGGTEVVDVENDPDVEKVDNQGKTEEESGGEEGAEELDVTELVTAQKDMGEKQQNYFDQLFKQLSQLEAKLGEMDNLVNKINSLEQAVERSRPKTPQEKLELRSLDSGPFNQKLTDFFDDKQQDIQRSGKNEYVLTSDEVENFSDSDIRGSFDIDMDKNFGI